MEKLSDSSLKIRPPHWYENLTKDEMSQPPLWKHRKDDNPTDQGKPYRSREHVSHVSFSTISIRQKEMGRMLGFKTSAAHPTGL